MSDTVGEGLPMKTTGYSQALSLPVIVGIALLTASASALAAPTLIGTTTNASGIDGIVVDGVTYDATFNTSSFDSTFSNEGVASDAAFALAADLNALAVTGLSFGGASGFDCTTPSFRFCGIYTGSSNQNFSAYIESGFSAWLATPLTVPLGCPGTSSLGPDCVEAAHWTKVTTGVPEPTTLALFALGLVGVGLWRRRFAG